MNALLEDKSDWKAKGWIGLAEETQQGFLFVFIV
jgi:hypothetical protein